MVLWALACNGVVDVHTEAFDVVMSSLHVRMLARAVGPAITAHVNDLCSQLAKKSMDPKHKSAVWTALQVRQPRGLIAVLELWWMCGVIVVPLFRVDAGGGGWTRGVRCD